VLALARVVCRPDSLTESVFRISPSSPPQFVAAQTDKKSENAEMLFILYYIVAITILVLHFTGFLARNNLEWLVLALAVTVFPAVIYL
jgi:hypothetical protein